MKGNRDHVAAIAKATSILVIAKPNARKTGITSFDEQAQVYHVDVAAPPEGGKANSVLLRLLQKLSGKQCRIIAGKSGKKKTIVFC